MGCSELKIGGDELMKITKDGPFLGAKKGPIAAPLRC
jgi:hypothetical protein